MNTALKILVTFTLTATLTACASYNTVLTNSAGKKYTCTAEGYGIIGSTVATSKHNSCVERAKEAGYVSAQ